LIVLALGSNKAGRWGDPAQTLRHAIRVMDEASSGYISAQSSIYRTAGVGPGRPADFCNAVVSYRGHLGPEALLRRLKQLEHRAGTRSALRWGPRTLDLDIIDYHGQIRGWRGVGMNETDPAVPGTIILPHPFMHLRPFVLEPLREILPLWRHPVFYRTAEQLARDQRHQRAGQILEKLD